MRSVAKELTVVVPTIGRPVLGRCLDALLDSTVRPGKVLIVDQSRDDAVLGLVDDAARLGLDVTRIPSAEQGVAAARNRGLNEATTRFIATIDDDCCALPDWTQRLLDRLLAYPGVVITGRVDPVGAGELPSTIVSVEEAMYHRPLPDRDPLFTGNMAAERSVFERVGPFNEHPALVPAAEDNEWGYRALTAGVAILYAPEVAVRHLDWRSSAELIATYRRYARGQGGFYGLYLRRGDWFIVRRTLRDVIRGMWLFSRSKLSGKRDITLTQTGGAHLFDLLAGILAGLTGGRRGGATTNVRG
jgi:GT2 family glycosyltransferase